MINLQDKITQSVAEAVKKVLAPDLKLSEGKMKELSALLKKGVKDPKKIAKEMGLPNDSKTLEAIAKLIESEIAPADQDKHDMHSVDIKADPEQEKQTEDAETDAEDAITEAKLAEYDFEEGNEFTAAAAKAKLAGEDEFEFDGKTYPTEISQDAAEKILGKKEETELDEDVDNFFGFPTKDGLVKFQSMAKKLRIKAFGNPIVMKRGGKEFHVMGFKGSVRDIEKAMKVAAGMQEENDVIEIQVTEALSKNDKTAGYAGRGQFDLKRHIMPLVDKNKSLKDIYFDGPDLVGDTKSGKQPTIAKGVLTDKKMTVGDLEKIIKNFKG